MNVTTFQKVVLVPCARIPVKLRFAKIQIADAPLSVPVGLDIPCASAGEQSAAKARASRDRSLVFWFEALLSILAF